MTARRIWMTGLIPVFVCGLTACGPSAPDGEETGKPALTVDLVHVDQRMWPRTVTASGAVQAWQEVSIGTEISGLKLAEVLVDAGDAVKRGQLLARLSDEIERAELAAQRAVLAEAKAAYAQATGEKRRAHELDVSGAISQQELIQFDTQAETAAARLASAQAQLDSRRIRLRHTRVVAPDDGLIAARPATAGAVVSIGTELFRLIRRNRLEWRAEVRSDLLSQIQPGQAVRLRGMDGSAVDGRVRRIAPAVDANTRNGLVYVDLPPTAGEANGVKSGMYLSGDVLLGDAQAATLPETAVFSRDGYDYAMSISSQNRARQTKLTTGRRQDGRVEVTRGVAPGAAVVAAGAAFLNDGDMVRIAGRDVAVPATAASVPAGAAQ